MFEAPVNEADRLAALHDLAILDTDPEPHFDALCRTAAALFSTPIALITLVGQDWQWFKARCGIDVDGTAREISFCTHAIRSDTLMIVEDAAEDARFRDNPLVRGAPGIRFYAGAPLTLRPGIRVGTLCVIDTQPRAFSPDDRRQLEDLAIIAVAHLRQYEARVACQAEAALRRASEVRAREQAEKLRRREADLHEANRLLMLAEQIAHIGHWQIDIATERVMWSDEVFRIRGLEPSGPPLSLDEVVAAYHPDDRARVARCIEAALTHGEGFEVQARLIRPDGGVCEVVSRGICAIARDGAATVFGTIQDVTEITRAQEKLRASEERLALALDSGSDGLWDCDLRARRTWMSDRYQTMLGYQPGELGDGPETWVNLLHPDDLSGVLDLLRTHLEGRSPAFESEYRLRRKDGSWAWVLSRGKVVARDTAGEPLRMVGTHIDITERKEVQARIAHLARHDALTDLPNRALLRERLEQRLAEVRHSGDRCGLFYMDLDRFKLANDTLGHSTGDALLREIARRIRSVLGAEDTAARLGGDEFAVLLGRDVRPEDATALAERLIEVVGEPMNLCGQQVSVGLSVGIAFAPEHGLDCDALLKRADIALYRAKAEGRNTHRIFAPAMDEAVEERRRLELDLHLALRRGEFELHYQPIIDVASGAVSAVEALVRWHHPVRGLMSPGTFVSLAEETGLVVPLGEWVLRTATRDAGRFPAHVRMAVNVSAVQVRHASLIRTVQAALDASGLDPARLELEITESLLMDEGDHVREVLHGLRGLGVSLALDDFGTGYSSLSYLRRFPFDKIKIDRSFVAGIADPETGAIVRAVVGLGQALGMTVTAEGIETPEQLALVRAEGCTQAQGYLLGRPQAVADVLPILRGDVLDTSAA